MTHRGHRARADVQYCTQSNGTNQKDLTKRELLRRMPRNNVANFVTCISTGFHVNRE